MSVIVELLFAVRILHCLYCRKPHDWLYNIFTVCHLVNTLKSKIQTSVFYKYSQFGKFSHGLANILIKTSGFIQASLC